MTWLRDLCRRLWPLVDWRRAAVLEARHRGAAAMLDESMRRQQAFLALPYVPHSPPLPPTDDDWQEMERELGYRLGDSDGTWSREPGDVPRSVEPSGVQVKRLVGEWIPFDGTVENGLIKFDAPPGEAAWFAYTEPTDGEAAEPRTIVVDRDVLMRRAREASEGGADYLPPWTGEGL